MSNQNRGNIALAHDGKPQALNTVINMPSSELRKSREVLWWGFVGVKISVLSNLVLFKIELVCKTTCRSKGNAVGIPSNADYRKPRNWLKLLLRASTSINHL
jgi:hypothetical protein